MNKGEITKRILSTPRGEIIHFKVTDKEYIEVAEELCNLGMLQRLSNEYYTAYPIRFLYLNRVR